MLNILIVAHIILILLLASWIFAVSKELKISITIHNLPIILLTALALCITTWWVKYNPEYFFPTGILVGFIVFLVNFIQVPGYISPTIFKNILMSLFCILFWPEMIVLFWFIVSHIKKIDAKPQS